MKIAICEFHQETNSFNPKPSPIEDYAVFGLWEGQEILDQGHGPSALGGMLDTLEHSGVQVIPTCRMWANAAGPVEAGVVRGFLKKLLPYLQAALPLDGVCVSLHGATQSTESDDVCGDLLEAIRQTVGEKAVIAASLDLHANVTEKMQRNAEYLSGYHTYPHVDFYETGRRAATLCLRRLKGDGKPPVTMRTVVPMIIPASASYTISGPFAELIHYGESLVQEGKLLDFSVFQMQPWLDVPVGGSAIVTVSEKPDPHWAIELARKLLSIRHELHSELKSVEEIIRIAEKNDSGKPTVLVDSADSTNAGASGDSAFVLEKIQEMNSPVKAAVVLRDLPTVKKAFQVGVGNSGEFTIGATIDPKMSKPVKVTAYVRSLHDGVYTQEGPAKRGLVNHIGPSAVLKVGNTKIIATNYLLGPGDLQLFRGHGVEPTLCQLVAVKACTSFRVGYQPIAREIIEADTPGAASANLLRLPFRKLPRSFYPFHEIAAADIPQPVALR